jgi:hypothetical protein
MATYVVLEHMDVCEALQCAWCKCVEIARSLSMLDLLLCVLSSHRARLMSAQTMVLVQTSGHMADKCRTLYPSHGKS